jgi:hypothetical protein
MSAIHTVKRENQNKPELEYRWRQKVHSRSETIEGARSAGNALLRKPSSAPGTLENTSSGSRVYR